MVVWRKKHSRAFFDELDVLTRRLAEKVVEDVFITSVLPVSLD